MKKNIRKTMLVMAICTVVLSSQGCETVQTTQAGAVGVTRKQQMSTSLSREQIDKQSALAYNQLRAEAGQKHALNADANSLARVQMIVSRIIPQVSIYRPDAINWNWEVNIFKSEDVNAFCMAGGKIAVYTGLIEKLKITDDELAAVIGHEIAHALREHVREQQSKQQVLGGVGMVAMIGGALMGVNINPNLTQTGLQVAFGLPHSRQAEIEADDIGLELSARAGYDPKGAITLWQKMSTLGGGHPVEFLSTHPSPASRAVDLARVGQIVQPLYEAAIKNQLKR